MKFHELDRGAIARARLRLSEEDGEVATNSLAYTWPWRSDWYTMEFGECAGCGVFRFHFNGRTYYSLPFGSGDKSTVLRELFTGAVAKIIDESTNRRVDESGTVPAFGLLSETDVAALGPGWLVRELPELADYIYSARELAELKGTKFQQKRNFTHRFEKLGEWKYVELAAMDAAAFERDARAVLEAWIAGKTERNEELYVEIRALELVLAALGRGEGDALAAATGGVLYSLGRPVAFALGEPISRRMILESYEKAVPGVPGAFPTVTREFCRAALRGGYEFVNRAGADGNENLVKAKESWHPARKAPRYRAVKTRVEFATAADRPALAALWHEIFGDSPRAIDYFLGSIFGDSPRQNRRIDESTNRRIDKSTNRRIDEFLKGGYTLVLREAGEIASACFFLDLPDDVRYVYALMTRPVSRGKGYAREILSAAMALDLATFAVVPGEKSLVPFYESLGFAVSSPAEKREIALDDFAREFYRLDGVDGTVTCELPTMTFPPSPGYRVEVPLN